MSISKSKPQISLVACATYLSTMILVAAPLTPPGVSKVFTPSTITAGATSTLKFTVTNPNAAIALSGVTFTDTFPANLVLAATGTQTASCTGVGSAFGGVAATLGGTTVGLNSTVIGPSGSCTFTVLVQGNTAGPITNTVTASDITQGAGSPGTATLQVNAPLSVTLAKTFGTATVGVNGTTTVTFTLSNPNTTVPLTFSLIDGLPPGLIFADPNGLINTCGGTFIMSNRLEFGLNATLAPSATCTLTVNVNGVVDGPVTNLSAAQSGGNGPLVFASADIFVGQPFQVRYTSNLAIGDSVINFTNTGEGVPAPIGDAPVAGAPVVSDSLCVNVYAFSPDEQLVSCCSCLVTPNGLASLSAVSDLTSNTLTPGRPTSIVVKLLATSAAGVAPACNAATAGTPANPLQNGLAAWGTTIHPLPVTVGSPVGTFGITETRFVPAMLSAAELTRITTLCGFIQITGSGFGICKSCRLGGLGGMKQ